MSDRYKGAILSPTAPTVTLQSANGIYTSSQQLQYQGQGVWPSAANNPLTNSLRFRSSASAYLNRTMTTATNNLKWTWSGWVKRGKLADTNIVFGAGDGTSNNFGAMQFTTGDVIQYSQINSGSYVVRVSTNAVFRDPSAWYHVVLVYDSPNATSTDRVQIYVNGTRQSVTYATGPFAQNTSSSINSALAHYISKLDYASLYFDGYMAEINFIDGQALTPSSFGTTDVYGIWQPTPYTGTYGTNGFYLPFTDNSALTTTTNVGLGKDFSGNGNYWTTNNISITAGSTYDSMKDVPTNTNSNTANYATLNPLSAGSAAQAVLTNGNLNFGNTSSAGRDCWATITPQSGKWYWEVTAGSNSGAPAMVVAVSLQPGDSKRVRYSNDGTVTQSGLSGTSGTGSFTSYTTNDVIGVAFDVDSKSVKFYKNNTLQTTVLWTDSDLLTPYVSGLNFTSSSNFGQQPFTYTPPAGFVALNTYNLPTPTILDGDQYFNTTLYTGTGSALSVTNNGSMQPDLVWTKARSTTYNNSLVDAVRGVSKSLQSNLTNAEDNSPGSYVTAFNSNGFTVGTGTASNNNGTTYAAWQWKANGSGLSNTQGTITSTVSANTTAGFSIVTYTGNGTVGATIGHGLGVTPSMFIVKQRTGGLEAWQVYHSALGATQYLLLNSDAAAGTNINRWNNTAPTSTVFTVYNDTVNNGNTYTYVAYCFANVSGYSQFGSYTGNGSADGPFVFTGFRPQFILLKGSSAGLLENWHIYDSARNTYNVLDLMLRPNSSAAETTFTTLDFVSNGFKIRNSNSAFNTNGATYIYAAFAENPFKIARAR